uniref:Non-specific protein-tyrosine kinase n=1 Tax=Angiostrongylus cantonensis TaxID=6313 RepID=A0A158P7Z1_ANGCA
LQLSNFSPPSTPYGDHLSVEKSCFLPSPTIDSGRPNSDDEDRRMEMKEDSQRNIVERLLPQVKDEEAVEPPLPQIIRTDASDGEVGKKPEDGKKSTDLEEASSDNGDGTKNAPNAPGAPSVPSAPSMPSIPSIPCTPNTLSPQPQIVNVEAKKELSPPALLNRIGKDRYFIIESAEKETMEKAMATFVDEAAERITAVGYSDRLIDLQHEAWYHGALPLEDISALLTSTGEFLIRELEPDDLRGPMPCLTVRLGALLKDFPIHTVQIGEPRYFTIDGTHKARTVVGIVQLKCQSRKHYEEKIAIQDDTLLLKPIPKQPWELSKDKIALIKKLGEGAFGEVWQGTLRQSATRTVLAAIKVKTVSIKISSNVVSFFGMIIEDDNVMIVMEMVNGGGLDHYLKKNTVRKFFASIFTFSLFLFFCSTFFNKQNQCSSYIKVVKDLACRNCLIDTEKNIVKISDFGLSKQADVYKIQPNDKVPTKWQAPEVMAKHIYTRECDVYSYGIVIWEIFNNAKTPFEEYDNKTVRQRLSDPRFRPPLSDDIPKEIRVVVTACWSAAPENRPAMKEVAWILRRFLKHNGPGRICEQPTPPTPVPNPIAIAHASTKATKRAYTTQQLTTPTTQARKGGAVGATGMKITAAVSGRRDGKKAR